MIRTLNQTLSLTREEASEAILLWLVQVHDIRVGNKPHVDFGIEFQCDITSCDDVEIDLLGKGGNDGKS